MQIRALLLIAILFLPSFASASIPSFPAAFWGRVTINGKPAPIGTEIRAYYGAELAGSVTVNEEGVYGYTEPSKQKLVIGEGEGPITFTVRSHDHNSGNETAGNDPVVYSGFTPAETIQKDLSFVISVSDSSNNSSGGSNGGSRSRSSGGGSSNDQSSGQVLGAATTASDMTILRKQLIAALTQLVLLLQQKLALMQANSQ